MSALPAAAALGIAALAVVIQARDAHAQELRPPHVVHLPELDIPENMAPPTMDAVEVRVVVGIDGRAVLVACEADAELCELVKEALTNATFEPATRDGAAISAQVRLRVRIHRALSEPPPAPPTGQTPTPHERTPIASPEPPPPSETRTLDTSYGATATVPNVPQGTRRLELEELRDMPGAFGDPFRAIDALPGVVPIVTGLPYFYLRGSPPSGTIYVYDDIPLPALFHLAFGPAVIHPRMIGPIDLYSGAAPARYGRHTGGVVVAEGPGPYDPLRVIGEVELRLLDVSGMIQAPLWGGSITAAARYGYPALLLSIFVPELTLAYWDYQFRLDIPTGSRDRVQVVALGSYDLASDDDDNDGGQNFSDSDDITLQFHRIELRFLRRLHEALFGVALRFGIEESTLAEEFRVRSTTFGPRVFLELEHGSTAWRFGADLIGAAGDITTNDTDSDDNEPLEPGDNPLYDSVAARNVGGVYGQVMFRPAARWLAELGARADFWSTGTSIDASLDPRARVTFEATRTLDLHVAAGVTRQPAVFIIPLPGLTDVALDRGLQTATQMEVGVAVEAPWKLLAEARFFLHHYSNLLFPDAIIEDTGPLCTNELGCLDTGLDPRTDGIAYGTELYLRRKVSERLSGWISYTLGWAHVDDVGGVPYTPVHDVRHVANVVASYVFGGGFQAGLRLHARSGKPFNYTYVVVHRASEPGYDADTLTLARYQQRQPWFVRGDFQISYTYATSWGQMRWMLELVNFTLSREPGGMECQETHPDGSPITPCSFDKSPRFALPNLGVRGTF